MLQRHLTCPIRVNKPPANYLINANGINQPLNGTTPTSTKNLFLKQQSLFLIAEKDFGDEEKDRGQPPYRPNHTHIHRTHRTTSTRIKDSGCVRRGNTMGVR